MGEILDNQSCSGNVGKARAADSSDEGSFAPYTATEKHLLAAESAPITVKALLIGSRPNLA